MSALDAASGQDAGAVPAKRQRDLVDRLLDVWPLAFSFLLVASLYVWQASKHRTPWLFSDEIEYAQISRAIAETGIPARRGVEYWGAGLFPWVIAPFWWIHNLQTAYGAVKTFHVLVMTAAMFPTYALARLLVSRPYALLAAVGSVLAPFFIYTAMVMEEPTGYFTAALAFYVLARTLLSPTRWWIAGSVVLALVAPFVRDELIVVPALMIGAFLIRSAFAGRGREIFVRASIGRRIAIVAGLVVLTVLGLAVFAKGQGQAWDAFSRPGIMRDQALWAWGALLTGLGVFPVVIGTAMVVPAKGIPRTRQVVAFTSMLATGLVLFTFYTAIKGAYQAGVFEARVEERNLFYLAPLLFVALALFLSTRAIQVASLAVTAALAAWAIRAVPLSLNGLEGDAPGLAILSRFHDRHQMEVEGAKRLLFLLLVVTIVVALVPMLVRNTRIAQAVVVGAAVLAIGWGGWGETVAAKYSNDFSDLFYNGLPKPLNWVDEETHGQPAVYIGQKIADPNGIWSMEFWNRDVRKVYSLDGTAPGPGPTLTPDLAATDGTLRGDPGYPYAVIDNGLSIDGDTVATQGQLRLMRIAKPLRLKDSLAGVFNDGWIGSMGPQGSVIADYNTFDVADTPGTVFVTLSRRGFCGPHAPGHVLIEVGTIALGQQRNGVLGKTTQRRGWTIDSCAERTFPIPTPGGPFHVRITITPPFQPQAVDPKNFERRYFGAQLALAYENGG